MNSPASAAAVLDYWCELQCPDCHHARQDLDALRAKYGDALRIRLRHFPLSKHRHAYAAAQAAEEAYAQGRGEAFVTAVLARTGELAEQGEKLLVATAAELGMDAGEVESALVDGRHLLIVDADQAEGAAIGVRGTPTYGVGGHLLDGSRSQEGLRERIEEIVDGLLAG